MLLILCSSWEGEVIVEVDRGFCLYFIEKCECAFSAVFAVLFLLCSSAAKIYNYLFVCKILCAVIACLLLFVVRVR